MPRDNIQPMMVLRTYLCLLVTLTLSVIYAEKALAGQRCPFFTAEMVDAAAMASSLTNAGSYTGTAAYDPVFPSIRCDFRGFFLRVNTGEDAGVIIVEGTSREPTTSDLTRLNSSGHLSSTAETRACIAEVLRSFVWNNYCDKFIDTAQ